ncbi:MAG: alpha-1,3-galactosidase, partial [Muribaculaceae bacterium]|nr:alpha-1,3-galactosidase [Muribaculaceae bacterium]
MKISGLILVAITAAYTAATAATTNVITVRPVDDDATEHLQAAIDSAGRLAGKPVEIHLSPGDYHISWYMAAQRCYHISNTASAEENLDPTKHIGMLFKNMSDVIVDGHGARLITCGEMTPWVIDSCENIVIRNLTVTAGDPSVPEMTVTAITDSTMTTKVTPPSQYAIDNDGHLVWWGAGWEIDGGIAQILYPDRGVTLRCGSPLIESRKVSELSPGELMFHFNKTPPDTRPGDIYQMRHSIRNEVAGLINRSRNITLENLQLQFMGNFGIVAQFSDNITYRSLTCAPDEASGRTCAGFADFLQLSGCRGKVIIEGCNFSGSQDDPINIHGTHLSVV